MYGKKSEEIGVKLRRLELAGKENTAEYQELVRKWNKARQEELKAFNKNWRANSQKERDKNAPPKKKWYEI